MSPTIQQQKSKAQFTTASTQSVRKNRKIQRTLPQLKRNAACVPCRRRRIKCDGAKPFCSSCVRSFSFLARTQPDPERDDKGNQCLYEDQDEEEETSDEVEGMMPSTQLPEKRKLGSSSAEASGSVGEEGHFTSSKRMSGQNQLGDYPAISSATSANSGAHTPPYNNQPEILHHAFSTFPLPDVSYPSTSTENIYIPPYDNTQQGSTSAVYGVTGNGTSSNGHNGYNAGNGTINPSGINNLLDAGAGELGGPFVDIFWPGWPKRLPTPAMLDHLVHVFFTTVPSVHRLIHRQSLMARLALSPTHPDFPNVSLLHAICAVAARYTAAVHVCSVAEVVAKSLNSFQGQATDGPSSPGDENLARENCFSERHAGYAIMEMKTDDPRGVNLYSILQTQLVLSFYHFQTAKWLEGWLMVGSMVRSAVALGLMDEAVPEESEGPTRLRQYILQPPKHDWEREERRAAMYYLVSVDAVFSASGSWAGTLPLDEVYAHLPTSKPDFKRGNRIPENPQTLHSRDLFTNHPVPCSFVLCMKGMILLSQVGQVTRRIKRMAPGEKLYARRLPDFLTVERDLLDLMRTFPAALRDPLQSCEGDTNRLDADLINAHLVPRIATILLHEPFADLSDPQCSSRLRMLEAARGVLNIVYLVINSNSDVALVLLPVSSVYDHLSRSTIKLTRCRWFYHAARNLCLFYHHALRIGHHQAAQTLLSELEVFQTAFASLGSRFAMGAIHGGMLDMMIRRINEEFHLPQQQWAFMAPSNINPALPGTSTSAAKLVTQHVSAIPGAGARNYRAGNRDFNPEVIANNTETFLWNTGASSLSTQEILDHQRSFVGSSFGSSSDPEHMLNGQDDYRFHGDGNHGSGLSSNNGFGSHFGTAQVANTGPIDGLDILGLSSNHGHASAGSHENHGGLKAGGRDAMMGDMAHVVMSVGDSSTYSLADHRQD